MTEQETLHHAQVEFALGIAKLIERAFDMGYEVTLGEGYNAEGVGHMKGSLHYSKLAQDLCLFKDGKYLTDTKDYEPLGEIWEAWGFAWGGRFSDGNHFSHPWAGKK